MGDRTADLAATIHLLDGRQAYLRRLDADDRDKVLRLHQNLTDGDRYFRFFTLHPVGLKQLAADLTAVGTGRAAIGAFDADHLIGVANYVVCDDPDVAEMAILVAHDEHVHGVGTALLKHLAYVARADGIRHFLADVMTENRLMLKVLTDLGWPRRRLSAGSVLRLEIDLPGPTTGPAADEV